MNESNAEPGRTDATLLAMIDHFRRTGRTRTVHFRKLVPWVAASDRATHYLHPYPAKLLPQIPIFFLSNDVLSKAGGLVVDPFCGSGTVLVEAMLNSRNAIGADANPLARLISTAKVSRADPEQFRRTSVRVTRRAKRVVAADAPSSVNIKYWFHPHVIKQLSQLSQAIEREQDPDQLTLLRATLSACARRVSLADPRLSVPVRLRRDQYPPGHPFRDAMNARLARLKRQDVFAEFEELVSANAQRLDEFQISLRADTHADAIIEDARTLDIALRARQLEADLVITSPPYPGAQKYIRSSSLGLAWSGISRGVAHADLERLNIGREHVPRTRQRPPETGIREADRVITRVYADDPQRAWIVATYLIEMRVALRATAASLRRGGYLVLVAGNSSVRKLTFRTATYLENILHDFGLETRLRLVDAIHSRGLMTRRNRTADIIARENVIVMHKPECPSVTGS